MIFVTLVGRSHEYSGLRALLVWSALPALLGYIPLDTGGISAVAFELPFWGKVVRAAIRRL